MHAQPSSSACCPSRSAPGHRALWQQTRNLAFFVATGALGCTLTAEDYRPVLAGAAGAAASIAPLEGGSSGAGDSQLLSADDSTTPNPTVPDAGAALESPLGGEGTDIVDLEPRACAPNMQDCDPTPCNGSECDLALCTDGAMSPDESDVDCGGACPPCRVGAACTEADDCVSGVCAEDSCSGPSCDDGVLNGDEADTDCGAACAVLCAATARCGTDADCASSRCIDARCAAATCNDGVQNSDETDIDCGGSCEVCSDEAACTAGGDCSSGICTPGACTTGLCCQPPSCADGVQNGDEAGVDCGGSDPTCFPCCSVNQGPNLAQRGTITFVSDNACTTISQFPGFSPAYLESFTAGTFPVAVHWTQECTGANGTGTFGASYTQVPLTGATDACAIAVQFLGPGNPLEIRWY